MQLISLVNLLFNHNEDSFQRQLFMQVSDSHAVKDIIMSHEALFPVALQRHPPQSRLWTADVGF